MAPGNKNQDQHFGVPTFYKNKINLLIILLFRQSFSDRDFLDDGLTFAVSTISPFPFLVQTNAAIF